MLNEELRWQGPFALLGLLEHSYPPTYEKIHSNGVYLISLSSWEGTPTRDCQALYVGSSKQLWTRLGETIRCALGLFDPKDYSSGHSSGGKSLHDYCVKHKLKPWELYYAFAGCDCRFCVEAGLIRDLSPELNRKRSPRCLIHKQGE
jgi:hypothetical protein